MTPDGDLIARKLPARFFFFFAILRPNALPLSLAAARYTLHANYGGVSSSRSATHKPVAFLFTGEKTKDWRGGGGRGGNGIQNIAARLSEDGSEK